MMKGKSITKARVAQLPDRGDGAAVRMPLILFAVAVAVSIGITFLFHSNARKSDEARFANARSRMRYAIEGRVSLYIGFLRATRAFVESPDNLERAKFEMFIRDVGIGVVYRGIQGIGYTKVIKPGEMEALARRMRSEGFPQFTPYPATDREVQQAIIYLEPQDDRNKRAIGFDMTSEPRRKAAIDRARDTGVPTATARVSLVQEITEDKQAGFLIYIPVYSGNQVPATVDERRERIQGFVYAPFRAGDFFEEIKKVVGSEHVAVSAYDEVQEADSLLFSDGDGGGDGNGGSFLSSKLSAKDELEVGGRNWLVLYRTENSFSADSAVKWTPFVLLVGLCVSFVLFALLRREARARLAVERVAKELIDAESVNQELFEKEITARRQAESANKVKDEFISVVSHELRTPLNAIAGWARVLRGHDVSDATRLSALEKIDRNLRLQSALVEDLLNFSQIVSGGFELQKGTVDVSAAICSVLAELEPAVVEKKLIVLAHDGSGGRRIQGDADKLRLVILKLLSNAVKFTPAHGQIDISLEATDSRMVLSVKDTGRGINKELLPLIFKSFVQDDTSTTRKFGGLGLGLSICEHVVRLHGGTIEAASAGEDRGAEFVVKLPIG